MLISMVSYYLEFLLVPDKHKNGLTIIKLIFCEGSCNIIDMESDILLESRICWQKHPQQEKINAACNCQKASE